MYDHPFEYNPTWVVFLLVAVVLACVLWSAHVGWRTRLGPFAVVSGLGLLSGIVITKQHGRRRLCGHILASGIGLLAAWWQTSVVFFHNRPAEVAHTLVRWIGFVFSGGAGANSAIFLFTGLLLASTLSYGSVWCVVRTRWLWPMLATQLSLVFCLLYPMWDENLAVFMTFALASLLLSLHVHLDASIQEWADVGTVYPVRMKRVMKRLGAILAVSILLLAWVLPASYVNPTAANLWSEVQEQWSSQFSVQQTSLLTTTLPFSRILSLASSPDLSPEMVATVQSPESRVYLQARWYDTYIGIAWTNGQVQVLPYHGQETLPSQGLMTSPLRQTITVMAPSQQYYLLGAPGINTVSLPASILTSTWNGEPIAWFARNTTLAAGTQYTVTSSVSIADASILRSVPPPFDAEQSVSLSSPLFPFLQVPFNLDPRIAQLARQITAGASSMYDKVLALETYLRTHYTYNLQVELPPGEEAVSWFLFRSGHQGYCTYFATAMAIMARLMGIPARVVTGYAPGTYDAQGQRQIIRGTDAHSWTQIYFPGYGWINFEPTAGFTPFGRTLPNSTLPDRMNFHGLHENYAVPGIYQLLGLSTAGLTTFLLILCFFCGLWWQRLRPRTQVWELYRCVCLFATWARCPPHPSQTPYEYMRRLLPLMPQAKAPLERMCDLHSRERWAHPASTEHPRATGEWREVADLWAQLRPALVRLILQRWACLLLLKRRSNRRPLQTDGR
jgi:hypothetical protein